MSGAFQRFAGGAAIAVAIGGVAYSIVFVVAVKAGSSAADAASWLLLTLGGLLSTAVVIALYLRLRDVDAGFALWAALLGLGGAVGSTLHGGWYLAAILHPEEVEATAPSYTDPRGLATFALTGLSIALFSWLTRRGGGLPRELGTLGFVLGALMVLVYLGRLFIVDADNLALLVVAGITGVILYPLWFVRLGLALRRA